MVKFSLSLGVVLLSLSACAPSEYGYTTSVSNYSPDYETNYAPAYGYSQPQPAYLPPPFWNSGLQLQFGGGRRHHRRWQEGEWDRGD